MQLTIGGETFEVVVEGADESPAVMLSCSLGTDHRLFDAQMPSLLEHFRVVRYDPRGHGGSTTDGAPYSLTRLGRDALAILDELAIETAHFVGISMGGAVGQWLLVNAPARIRRAVLANTSARFGTPDLWNARIATVLAEGTQALAPATMERWFSPAFHAEAAERVAAVEAMFRKTSAEGYAGACAALRDMDMRTAIRAVDRPVLIVTGADDAVASAADIATMTGAIRGARHLELECRHISNIEQDAAFNAAIVAFLTSPARAARPPRKPPTPRRAATRRTAARSPLTPARSSQDGTKRTRAASANARGAARGGLPKSAPGKTTTGKSTAGKSTTGKAAAGRTPVKTTASGQAKVEPRKTAARRAAVPATPRKAATKKSAAKKAVVKDTAAKKAAVKKPAKKAVAKRTVAKKVATKTSAPKTPAARRPAATRRPSSKRPGRPGGRPKR